MTSNYLQRFFILTFVLVIACIQTPWEAYAQPRPLKIYISVDMEGIGGIGTWNMVGSTLGRELMTEEVNSVISAIFTNGTAEIVVNDAHGDMQNLLHMRLDPRVTYIQGNIKPLGMMQGLDASFDAAIFLGYHSRAGTASGLMAHTGSGAVKGLWINGTELGEGGLNAYLAGAQGVPVILASGDSTFTLEIRQLVPTKTVVTKEAIGTQSARLYHPTIIRQRLSQSTIEALSDLPNARPLAVKEPVTFRIRFATTRRADIVESIPRIHRIDGYTVEYQADTMLEAYKLIRLMYGFISE